MNEDVFADMVDRVNGSLSCTDKRIKLLSELYSNGEISPICFIEKLIEFLLEELEGQKEGDRDEI